MEELHLADARSAWISPPVSVGEHMASFSALVQSTRPPGCKGDLRQLSSKKMIALMGGAGDGSDGLDEAALHDIESICSPDQLTIPDELPAMTISTPAPNSDLLRFRPAQIPQSGIDCLETLRSQQKFLDSTTAAERTHRLRGLRHFNNNWFEARRPAPAKINPNLLEKEKPPSGSSTAPLSALRYSQEIHMLGGQTLAELRDVIACTADCTVRGDVSENAVEVAGPAGRKKKRWAKAGEIYKSGFFYIGDCFYNDLRHPDCIDYSEVIRSWAEKGNRRMGPFQTAKMEETKLSDLTLRVGYPYVYVHQGDHEHLLTFHDVRLLTVEDSHRPSDYPLVRSVGSKHSVYCMACTTTEANPLRRVKLNKNIAAWVVTGSDRLPEEPFFFCDKCFKSYNYTSEGAKIGRFKAFPYVDANAI